MLAKRKENGTIEPSNGRRNSVRKVQEVTREAVGIHGKFGVAVNNARCVAFGRWRTDTLGPKYDAGEPQETLDYFNANLFGGLNATRQYQSYMRPRNAGTIVWITSLTGYQGVDKRYGISVALESGSPIPKAGQRG